MKIFSEVYDIEILVQCNHGQSTFRERLLYK